MRRTKSGLPKHCSWAVDRHGKRRVRFRKGGFSTYLTGIPWSEDFMRLRAAALEGVKLQAAHDCWHRQCAGRGLSRSLFKLAVQDVRQRDAAHATLRARKLPPRTRNKPLYRIEGSRRVMLLTREHVQRIVNEKTATPFAQHNLLKTLRAMFEWAVGEGRIHDNPALGVKRVKVKTPGYKSWSEAKIAAVNVPSRVVRVDGVGSDEMILRNSRDGRHFELPK